MMKDTIYRVVDTEGKTYSGWNNVNGIYNSDRTARVQLNKELQYRKRHQESLARNGKDLIEYSPLRIQKATIEWGDV
jgi:hypothetical protein